MFTDKGIVRVRAGDGGNGIISFRRERYEDMGGPDGGDGGDGGDVIFIGERNLNTLRSFRYSQLLKAKDGQAGSKAKMHGRNGPDLIVKVPIGTVIHERDGNVIGEIIEQGQQMIVASGGDGGFGNAHFKSSRRQAPRVAENGEPGGAFVAELELKILADVGLVGLPNAGKSTFLSVVSNAKPQIADYPFTTLTPNLGVADIDSSSLLIADIPGLIEGASEGKGLGDEFLRHIERTAVLLHLIDAYSDNIEKDFKTIRNELKRYKLDLTDRPIITVMTKIDGLDKTKIKNQLKKLKKLVGKEQLLSISSISHEGLDEVLRDATAAVVAERAIKAAEAEEEEEDDPETVVYELQTKFDDWTVTVEDNNTFRVVGSKIEKFARRTNYDNEWGVYRLKDIMRKMNIMHDLDRKGASAGSVIYFGKRDQWKITLD